MTFDEALNQITNRLRQLATSQLGDGDDGHTECAHALTGACLSVQGAQDVLHKFGYDEDEAPL